MMTMMPTCSFLLLRDKKFLGGSVRDNWKYPGSSDPRFITTDMYVLCSLLAWCLLHGVVGGESVGLQRVRNGLFDHFEKIIQLTVYENEFFWFAQCAPHEPC